MSKSKERERTISNKENVPVSNMFKGSKLSSTSLATPKPLFKRKAEDDLPPTEIKQVKLS